MARQYICRWAQMCAPPGERIDGCPFVPSLEIDVLDNDATKKANSPSEDDQHNLGKQGFWDFVELGVIASGNKSAAASRSLRSESGDSVNQSKIAKTDNNGSQRSTVLRASMG